LKRRKPSPFSIAPSQLNAAAQNPTVDAAKTLITKEQLGCRLLITIIFQSEDWLTSNKDIIKKLTSMQRTAHGMRKISNIASHLPDRAPS